jgi:hypothetical protein
MTAHEMYFFSLLGRTIMLPIPLSSLETQIGSSHAKIISKEEASLR